jgi:hypothetical protein
MMTCAERAVRSPRAYREAEEGRPLTDAEKDLIAYKVKSLMKKK